MAHRRIDDVVEVFPFITYDIWDLAKGRSEVNATTTHSTYSDEAGLDVEVALEFSADNRFLLVSSARCVRLYRVTMHGGRWSLTPERDIRLADALVKILGSVDYSCAVGGSAALSPDGKSLAWVVFCGSPASVFVTIWDVARGCCRAFRETAKVHPRRWSSLGWARVTYAPNGAYLLLVVNTARMAVRLERVEGEFRRLKLCKFVLLVFEARTGVALPASSTMGMANPREVVLVRERCEWLELEPGVFAKNLGSAVATTVEGLVFTESTEEFGRGPSLLPQNRQLFKRGLGLNGVHSCPGEATYKAISFGDAAKHAWLITKQPMFSLHFGISGERVHVTTSPHANVMHTLEMKGDGNERGSTRGGPRRLEFVVVSSVTRMNKMESFEMMRRRRAGPHRRKQVFRTMPWRTSFATITAFSGSGKWIVGAALLENDQCGVYLRNMTLAEYFE